MFQDKWLKWMISSDPSQLFFYMVKYPLGFPGGTVVKNLPPNERVTGSILGSGRFRGVGNGNLLQYSCLENSMVRGFWRATLHGVRESNTTEWLSMKVPYTKRKITTLFPSVYLGATWCEDWLIGKDPDAGKDWRQEKGTTEDEMVGWHYQLDGYESEQAPGVDDGQGSLACCSSWGCKELDTTEWMT